MKPRDFSKFLPEDPDRSRHDLVLEALAARSDHAKFIEFFCDDAVITIIGDVCDYLFSGVYRGRQNILALLRRVDAEIEMTDYKILNLVFDGDKMGLRRSVLVRHRGTAAARRLILGNYATLRDGRISELFEYVDTAWLKQLSGDAD